MNIMENSSGIIENRSIRESTHITMTNGRSGRQQIVNQGFGKMKNTDFEPLHYADN